MRYIITHKKAEDSAQPVALLTYAAEIADSAEQAIEQYSAKHPDQLVISAERVDDEHEAFKRYGMGAWTDEEQQTYRDKLSRRYAVTAREREEAEQIVSTYEPDEFEAVVAYMDRRDAEKTPNLEGIHVGDLFSVSWGYEQTNWNFYQVVGLRGKHTIVVRENKALCAEYGFMCGLSRPIRNQFHGEQRFTLRTNRDEARRGGLRIRAPRDYGYLDPCKDGQCFEFTSYA